MNIVLVHEYYLGGRGGEDVAFQNELELLRRHGHHVEIFEEHNARIPQLNPISVALQTIWSEESRKRLTVVLKKERPDIVHFQNTFPLISPSAYYACHKMRAAVVQTLHNYRLLCPLATLYRNGGVCEDCVGKPIAWPGILHACYHNSHSHTAVVSAMLATHRMLGTWETKVDAYIALTEFGRRKFVASGFPSHKIFLKPNIISFDPGPKHGYGDFALFVGRLSGEKGIHTLLSAWKSLPFPLKIVGDGPLREELLHELSAFGFKSVEYLGGVPHEEILSLMKNARILIFPSEWYEGFPLTIAEALACGLPMMASRLGAMSEIIQDGETGLLFTPGDSTELSDKVTQIWDNLEDLSRIARNARKEFEQKYTPERNYEMLMDIYSHALKNRDSQWK